MSDTEDEARAGDIRIWTGTHWTWAGEIDPDTVRFEDGMFKKRCACGVDVVTPLRVMVEQQSPCTCGRYHAPTMVSLDAVLALVGALDARVKALEAFKLLKENEECNKALREILAAIKERKAEKKA